MKAVTESSLVWLDTPLFRKHLRLTTTPQYLRFVLGRDTTGFKWDALDLPDDVPHEDEAIIVAEKSGTNVVHVDKTIDGKRVGEWYEHFEYKVCERRPTDEICRDNAKWNEWCRLHANQTSTPGQGTLPTL